MKYDISKKLKPIDSRMIKSLRVLNGDQRISLFDPNLKTIDTTCFLRHIEMKIKTPKPDDIDDFTLRNQLVELGYEKFIGNLNLIYTNVGLIKLYVDKNQPEQLAELYTETNNYFNLIKQYVDALDIPEQKDRFNEQILKELRDDALPKLYRALQDLEQPIKHTVSSNSNEVRGDLMTKLNIMPLERLKRIGYDYFWASRQIGDITIYPELIANLLNNGTFLA